MPLWQVVTPTDETSSLVISTLRGIKLPLQRWTIPIAPPTGEIGRLGAQDPTSTRSLSERCWRPVATYNSTEPAPDRPFLQVTSKRSGRLQVPKTGPKMGELEDVEIRLQPRSIAGYLL